MPQLLELYSILFETDADKATKSIDVLDKALSRITETSKLSVEEAGAFNERLVGLGTQAQEAARLLSRMSGADIDFSEQVAAISALREEFKLLPEDLAMQYGKDLGFDEETVKMLTSANSNIGDIIKKIKESHNPTQHLTMQMGALARTILVVAASASAVGATLVAAISSAVNTDEIGKFSRLVGTNVEEVDTWGKAVEAAGGDAGQFRSSLEGLTKSLTRLKFTGDPEIARDLNRIGVSVRGANGQLKSAIELIPEIAAAFNKLPEEDVLAIGERLGVDSGTLLLFKEAGNDVEELLGVISSLGVVTSEQAGMAREYNKQLFLLDVQFQAISREIGSRILPLLTKMFSTLRDMISLLMENKTFAVTFFTVMAVAITAVFLPALKAAAIALGVFIAPFALVLVKIGLITAAVTALALVVDDFVTYLEGGQSVFGDFLDTLYDKLDGIRSVFNVIHATIKALYDLAVALKDLFVGVFTDPMAAMTAFGNKISGIASNVAGAFKELDLLEAAEEFQVGVDMLPNLTPTGLGGSLGKKLGDMLWGALSPDVEAYDAPSPAGGAVHTGGGPVYTYPAGGEASSVPPSALVGAGRDALSNVTVVTNSPASKPQIMKPGNTRSYTIHVDEISVNTQATDTDTIFSTAVDSLKREFEKVVNNFDDGVQS